jgi:hypothetical protein
VVRATSRPAPGGRCTWSEPRARPRAAHAALAAALCRLCTNASEERPPCSPTDPRGTQSRWSPGSALCFHIAFPTQPTSLGFVGLAEAERGRQRRRGGGSCGGPRLEKVACPSPGGGGGGGRGKTMPRLRRGRRRQRARPAGRPGAGRLRGGARGSEALASTSPRPDVAGDKAGIQQPPLPPPPPPGGPSKSLDLGEGAALSGITTRAGRRPREPWQVTRTPQPSPSNPLGWAPLLLRAFPSSRQVWLRVRGRRSSRSWGRLPTADSRIKGIRMHRQLWRGGEIPQEWMRTLGPSWCLILYYASLEIWNVKSGTFSNPEYREMIDGFQLPPTLSLTLFSAFKKKSDLNSLLFAHFL